jgi:hypothetical protein
MEKFWDVPQRLIAHLKVYLLLSAPKAPNAGLVSLSQESQLYPHKGQSTHDPETVIFTEGQ